MNKLRHIILFIGDLVVIIASFFITLRLGFFYSFSQEIVSNHVLPMALVYTLWIIIIYLFNFYEMSKARPTLQNSQRIIGSFIVMFIIGGLFFYTLPIFDITPKTNLAINILSFGLLFIFWRRIFYFIFAVHFQERVMLISSHKLIRDELYHFLKQNKHLGMDIINIHNTFETFNERNISKKYDILITSESLPENPKLLKEFYGSRLQILDLNETYEYLLGKVPLDLIDQRWLLNNLQYIQKGMYDFLSRFLGIIISTIGLIVLSPIFLIIAIGIKVQDGGPIFFTHMRVGKNGQLFPFYKFRSMIINAEPRGPVWTPDKKDSRITFFGKLLRRSHLDEIPQLINVFKGDMALIGPRPERPEFVAELEKKIPHYHLRHIIKPGFTGWAQIKYRYAGSVEESHEKFAYDLFYIKNRNLFMDLGIIIRTIQIILTH